MQERERQWWPEPERPCLPHGSLEVIFLHPIIGRSFGDFGPFGGPGHGVCEHQSFDYKAIERL